MRNISTIAAAGAGLFALATITATAAAQEAPRRERQPRTAAQAGVDAGRLDEKTTSNALRASTLIGMDIQNPQGESVGEIHDLVIDTNQRQVRYAAVTYGGFLGLGDKLFAVPFQAFRCQTDPDDTDETLLILNVTQQQLEGARGFDEENWPNFADPEFTGELDARYPVRQNRRLRGAEVRIDGANVDVNVDTARRRSSGTDAQSRARTGRLDTKTHAGMVRASQLMGRNIQNSSGESVGEIDDLVIDGQDGKVRYAAVTYGGFLGLGDKLFAVPFDAFQCRPAAEDGDQYVLVLDVTPEQLEGAQGFDEDHWPNFGDQQFTNEIDRRYGIQTRTNNRGRDVGVRVNRDGVNIDVEKDDDRP